MANLESRRLQRADALDALRGFAILTMVLSGLVPRGTLPAWMYHAQIPPPDHVHNPGLPGIAWVDLVFPFFLFALGAAIPFALSSRLAAGHSRARIVGHVLLRGMLLLTFAVYIPHVDPWRIDESPSAGTWLLALLAFALMFPALCRLPVDWPARRIVATRLIGWGGAAALVAGVWYIGTGRLEWPCHSWTGLLTNINRIAERSDIIIVVLANVAVLGALVWLCTQHNPAARIAVMLALLGLRLAHDQPGWVKTLWDFHPIPRLYQLYFLQYLMIVLPGTIAGDLVRAWQRTKTSGTFPAEWPRGRLAAIAATGLLLNVFALCGLQARWLPWATPTGCLLLIAVGLLLVRRTASPLGHLISRLFRWGAVWLIIGLIFEPYEGGIKKDRATVSYYLVTSGLACYALAFFATMIDGLRLRGWFSVLIDNGQNPMIAYLGVRNLLPPLMVPTGLEALLVRLTPTPWLGVLRAFFKTTLLAYCVRLFTRLRCYWRT